MGTASTLVGRYGIRVSGIRGSGEILIPNGENPVRNPDKIIDEPSFGIEDLGREKLLAERARLVYPTIDTSFLRSSHPKKMRVGMDEDKLSMPHFAVYNLDSPVCSINVNFYDDGSIRDKSIQAPKNLLDCLASRILSSIKSAGNAHRVLNDISVYESRFCGILPNMAKDKIKEATRLFKDQIYIVAEAQNWQGESVVTHDPLIIGVRDNTSFLVSEFNCTPIEDYVRREFSTDGGK